MEELKNAIREISNLKPYKIVISNRKNKDVEYKKIPNCNNKLNTFYIKSTYDLNNLKTFK